MKKVGDLMSDLGFNPKASTSAQEAFLKHLIKAAHGVDVMTPSEKKIIQANPQKIIALKSLKYKESNQHQFAFDFENDPNEELFAVEAKKTGA